MGFFAGLNDEKYDRQYTDRELMRRITSFFKPQTTRLVWVLVFVVVLAVIGAALPIVVARMVDLLKGQTSLQAISLVGLAVLLIGIGLWALNWARRSLVVRAVGDVVLELRTRAFRAAAEHDLSFYDQFSSGRIVSRITSDTNDFGQLVVILTDVGSQIVQAILLAVVLFRTDLKLALMLISFLPVIFGVAAGFRVLARKITKRGMKAMADVNAAIKETISGISIAKNFRQEESIFKSFDESNQQSYHVNVQRGFVLSLVFPTLNALGGIFVAILIYVGGLSAAQGIITVGAWFLFIMSLDQFFFPVLNLSAFWAQIQAGLSAAERAFALIDADPNVVQTDKQDVPPLKGQIHFDNIHFQYVDKEPILSDFNLLVQPGETLALVGHTGAGKSSIAKLIARFYEYQQGRLQVDGHDIRTFDLAQYRRQLGIVSQVPFLFSGTVADNIRYAAPDVTDEDILTMARKIGDGDWLETLPNGIQTEVGERGGRLSMGQSQQALNLILKHSTSILIAHRLSTVKAADRIVVMEKGRIIEEGSHKSLLEGGGHYSTLYNTYFRHQSLAYVEKARELVGDD